MLTLGTHKPQQQEQQLRIKLTSQRFSFAFSFVIQHREILNPGTEIFSLVNYGICLCEDGKCFHNELDTIPGPELQSLPDSYKSLGPQLG